MVLKYNNSEGQPPDTLLNLADSGGLSGDAYDAVTGGGTCRYNDTQSAHGTQSLFVNASATIYVEWSGADETQAAVRVYVRLSTLPANTQDFVALRNSVSGSVKLQFTVTTGAIKVINAAGSTVKTFAGLSIDTWYRVELWAAKGTTTSNGTIKAAYYLLDSTSPVEAEYSSTATNAGTTNWTNVRLMHLTGSVPLACYFDDRTVSFGATDYIGPITAHVISGTATSTTSTVGAIGAAVPVSGAAASSTVTTGAITASGALSGAAVSVTTTAGMVASTAPIAGSAVSVTTTTGTIGSVAPITGTAVSTTTTAGTIGSGLPLTGAAVSVTTTSGAIETVVGTTDWPIAGAATSVSETSGSVTSGQAVSGQASSATATAGTLSWIATLAGAAVSITVTNGAMGTVQSISGAALSVTTTVGAITIPAPVHDSVFTVTGPTAFALTVSGPATFDAVSNASAFDLQAEGPVRW